MAIKDRRKIFMDYLDAIMNKLDPSGANSKLYHEKFDKMSDNQFDSYIKRFFEDDRLMLEDLKKDPAIQVNSTDLVIHKIMYVTRLFARIIYTKVFVK